MFVIFFYCTFALYFANHTDCCKDRKWFRHKEGGTVHPQKLQQATICHILFFFLTTGIFNRFLGSTGSMCCCESHMHAGAHKHIQYTHRCPLPSLCHSLSQMYFIINQLVAHLPACCFFFFFYINKALIAFSLECDLVLCAVFLWVPTLKDLFGLLHFSWVRGLLSNTSPQPSATLPSRHRETQRRRCRTKAKTNGPRHWLHRTMAEENNVYFKCRRKRKDVKLEGNQAGYLKSKDKYALQLHHKQSIYGVFQNRGQAA